MQRALRKSHKQIIDSTHTYTHTHIHCKELYKQLSHNLRIGQSCLVLKEFNIQSNLKVCNQPSLIACRNRIIKEILLRFCFVASYRWRVKKRTLKTCCLHWLLIFAVLANYSTYCRGVRTPIPIFNLKWRESTKLHTFLTSVKYVLLVLRQILILWSKGNKICPCNILKLVYRVRRLWVNWLPCI